MAKKKLLSSLLIPFSWIYLLLGFIRKTFSKQIKFPAFVICVGNATIGGSGKTQLVKWLIQNLKDQYKIVVVTKAYGSKLKESVWVNDLPANMVGDESKLLSLYAKVIASPKPAKALNLIKSYQPDIIIFDDGMQNPTFYKDLIIMTISDARGFGNGRIIPAGPMRMNPKDALNLADITVVVGGDLPVQVENDKQQVGSGIFDSSVIPAKADIQLLKRYSCANKNSNSSKRNCQDNLKYFLDSSLRGNNNYAYTTKYRAKNITFDKEYLAFAGISNPSSFFSLLRNNNAMVKITKPYPDHHNYNTQDLNELQNIAKTQNLTLITTEKDYVKIADKVNNLEHVKVELEFDSSEEQKLLKEIKSRIMLK